MVLTPRVGEDFFVDWQPPTGDDSALGVVDFSIFPHLDNPGCPENTMAEAERWAAGINGPAYAQHGGAATRSARRQPGPTSGASLVRVVQRFRRNPPRSRG